MRQRPKTHLLNVDLEVFSASPLDELAAAFGDRIRLLYSGRFGRRYAACFEVAGSGYQPDAEKLIRRFVALVAKLPRKPRRLWNRARSREFNIGIEAAKKSVPFELHLSEKTVEAVRKVAGTIVITVYAPTRVPRH